MNCVHYAMDTIVVAQMSFAATPPEHLTRSFQMGRGGGGGGFSHSEWQAQ